MFNLTDEKRIINAAFDYTMIDILLKAEGEGEGVREYITSQSKSSNIEREKKLQTFTVEEICALRYMKMKHD